MPAIGDRDELRWRLLRALYTATDGTPRFQRISMNKLAEILDTPAEDATSAAHWLVDREYTEWRAMGDGGLLGITAKGVDWVEDEEREKAAQNAVTATLSPSELRVVEAFLGRLNLAVERGEIDLPPDDQADLEAQRETIAAQLRSPRPNRRIVTTALTVIGSLVVGAASSGIYDLAKKVLSQLIG